MTAVSIQSTRGVSGTKLSDFAIDGLAPASLDMEVRYQLLDVNGAALTREDIILFIESVIRLLQEAGVQSPAGTFTLPGLGI
jgi:hypothetical protein